MSYRKLGRTSSRREAMSRDLTTDLLVSERIVATGARAGEVRSIAEKMITLGKRGDLHAHRQAAAFVRDEVASVRKENGDIVIKSTLQKLFNGIAPRYVERQGGYTRILKTGPRRGDGAPIVVLEFV